MSSPVDGTEKHHDHSAYAPKWVRDFNREGSHENTSTAADQQPETITEFLKSCAIE